jgi:hypothetical protein
MQSRPGWIALPRFQLYRLQLGLIGLAVFFTVLPDTWRLPEPVWNQLGVKPIPPYLGRLTGSVLPHDSSLKIGGVLMELTAQCAWGSLKAVLSEKPSSSYVCHCL